MKNGVKVRASRQSVTLDSNVVEYVVNPDKYKSSVPSVHFDQRLMQDYWMLHNYAIQQKIVPCVSEAYFTHEALENDGRRFLELLRKRYEGKENDEEPTDEDCYKFLTESRIVTSQDVTTVNCNIALNSNTVRLSSYRKKTLEWLRSVGGKIIPVNRLGWFKCKEICQGDYLGDVDDYNARMQIVTKILDKEWSGFNAFWPVDYICRQRSEDPMNNNLRPKRGDIILDNLGRLLALDDKKLSHCLGEAADGDMIATHYAARIDILCTNDFGKGYGGRSVFSSEFRIALENLGIVFETPTELVKKLMEVENV